MAKLQGKINELGMLEIPKAVCMLMEIEEGEILSITNAGSVIIIQKRSGEEKGYALDELHRVVLNSSIRKATGIEKNSVAELLFYDDVIFIKKQRKDEKTGQDILTKKCEIELEDYYEKILAEKDEWRKISMAGFYSLMRDMLSIVGCEKFDEAVIVKMLLQDNLLEKLADYYRWDCTEETDLMIKKTNEFIQKEFMAS